MHFTRNGLVTATKVLVTTVAGCCAIAVGQGVAAASPGGPGAPPAQPTIGQYSTLESQTLVGTEAQREATKQMQVKQLYAKAAAQWASAKATGVVSPDSLPTSLNLGEPYYQQVNEDWCGPATVVMIADYMHTGWTGMSSHDQQARAAYWLGTTSDGTAWYGSDNVPNYPGSSWYPVEDVLDYTRYVHNLGMPYVATPLPGTPTKSQQDTFKQDLVVDMNNHLPEAANQYSITGYNLPYQPNQPWMHWWSARGYESSGAITGINDPAAFANGVEHWVTTEGGAHTVVIALGGRGYIF